MTVVDASPYNLEPGIWRGLLARGAVFHATRRILGPLCDVAEHVDAVQLALIELDMAARQFSGDGDDVAVVASVIRDWELVLDRTIERTADDQARRLLVELKELARSACSEDPFHVIFEGIQAQAEALYGSFWRPARLLLAHTGSHPRKAELTHDPYAVTAVTLWPFERGEVELHIFLDKFGPAAYAALPILLTHEFVCHVPARQDRPKNDSEFAEGLLDWAAYFFLDSWAGKIDPQLAPAARRHAERLKQVLAKASVPEVHARRMGHEAAERLRAWFENDCALPEEECKPRVARLAVELNKVDRPLNAKDRFVVMLSSSTIPPAADAALRSWVMGETRAEQLLDVA